MSADRASAGLRTALGAVLVLGALVAAGAVGGLLWVWAWEPPVGVVHEGAWYLLPSAADDAFSATGWYVLIAFVVALLVTTAVCWRVRRGEVAVLAAVAVGSVLGGWVMYHLGHALGPAEPDVLARTADEGARLPAELTLAGLEGGPGLFRFETSALTAFPGGALLGLVVAFLLHGHARPSSDEYQHTAPGEHAAR